MNRSINLGFGDIVFKPGLVAIFLLSSTVFASPANNELSKKEDAYSKGSMSLAMLSSIDSARINQIALTGEYKKRIAPQNDITDTHKKVLVEKQTQESISKSRALKSKTKKNKVAEEKGRKRSRYCLGGSYKALAKRAKKYHKFISKHSSKYDVSEALIKAVITAESCFNSKAVSPKGAQGLMQLMPPTAKRFGVNNSFDPESNIKAGTRYLKFLLKYFDDDLLHAIAAYNAGEGAVRKYKGIPPYRETQFYVRKVAALYKLYSQGKGVLSLASIKGLYGRDFAKTIFVPRAMSESRLSPYKGRLRHVARGKCANRTGTRLKKSTYVQSGNGIWQRIYNVRRGDTLFKVMQETGVHKSKISQMNGISSRTRLTPGQQLLVWECRK